MEKTFYASAERADIAQLNTDYKQFSESDWLNSFINTLPEVVAVLNNERQIVFGNDVLLNLLGIKYKKDLLGLRPGEAMKCINSKLVEGGCGTSEKCKFCGAINSILESQHSLKKVTKECRITTSKEGITDYLDLKVTTAPFNFNNETFWILSIEDLTDVKRREVLEKMFFHDILNIVGSLKGVSDLLVDPDNDEQTSQEYKGIVNSLSKELLDEILAQRVLVFAEKGDLEPVFTEVSTLRLLEEPISYLAHHDVAKTKHVIIDSTAVDTMIVTDKTLINRVIINLTKNALEASKAADTITLNCIKENNIIKFTVHNTAFMPPYVQAQVFQRSFSTKGKGRGTGTYSIKLLTERYLKGSVSFTSTPEYGTTFTVSVPIV